MTFPVPTHQLDEAQRLYADTDRYDGPAYPDPLLKIRERARRRERLIAASTWWSIGLVTLIVWYFAAHYAGLI